MSWNRANHRGGGFRADRTNHQSTQNSVHQSQPPPTIQDSQRLSRQPIHNFDNERPNRQPQPPSHPVFNRRYFRAISVEEHQNHPDDLLQFIPDHAQAIADFDSSSPHRIHKRDMCSMVMSYLVDPAVKNNEPSWGVLLRDHLSAPTTFEPEMNLQDLYLWVTRVGLPNAIIDNRRFLLRYYLLNCNASPDLELRYDNQDSPATYTPLKALPQTARPERNHQIFRAYPNPNGVLFIEWLTNPIQGPEGPHGRLEMPVQIAHRVSVLDRYLNEDEYGVRRVERKAMFERTVVVLSLFWEVWRRNRVLLEMQDEEM